MKNDLIFETLFVPELHKKFLSETKIAPKFEAFMKEEGAHIRIDHGATRTVDPDIHQFVIRIAKAFGMQENRTYGFDSQNLTVTDLQHNDRHGFKWFSALIQTQDFSDKCQEAITQDSKATQHFLHDQPMALLEKLEHDQVLNEEEGSDLVQDILYYFLTRQGPMLQESTIEIVKAESEDTVNALAIGPEFNHLGYLLNDTAMPGYYGIEMIDIFNQKMTENGFALMPEILGIPGEIVRQNATLPEVIPFKVEAKNGTIIEHHYPAKFIEIIQRGIARDDLGNYLFNENNQPQRYESLLAPNIKSIYDATN